MRRTKAFFTLLFLYFSVVAVGAVPPAPPKVLVLYSYHDQLPWQRKLVDGVREGLDLQLDRVDLYEERLDGLRFPSTQAGVAFAARVVEKYKGVSFQSVIAESDEAASLLLALPKAFPGARRYFVNAQVDVPSGQGTKMDSDPNIGRALDLAASLTPAVKRIVFIESGEIRKQLVLDYGGAHPSPKAEIEVWTDFTFAELEDKVATLGPGTVVLYGLFSQDKTGQPAVPLEVLRRLVPRSKVPLFILYDTLLGSGAVGGYLLSAERVGGLIALLASGRSVPPGMRSFNEYIFDAPALERWGIPVSSLPPGSVVVNQPHDIWAEVAPWGLGILVFALLQTVIIVILLRRVSRRTAEIMVAKDEAEKARRLLRIRRAKSIFLSTMSHEIRTPLNAVIGLSHLLADTSLNEEQREYNTQIIASSRHLMGILGDILDLSKIESEQFTLEPVPVALAEIARGIEVVFGPPCAAKGVGLSVHWDTNLPQVKVDRLRLDQVLYNLVGNAVKFTEKGEVRVEFLLLTQQEGRVTVRFTVQDTGIGMDTEQQSRLFRPFTQADQGISRKYGGTGLGLSISQNLVRLMGGLIQVESAPGRGSLFRFELVLTMEAESSASTTEKPVLPDWKGRRALVVEDNAVSRAVALGLLRKLGLEAFAVEDGAQALECLQAETFDIVFMDVQMPVMDGLSASRELRSRGYRGPILALSAGATAEERKAVIEAGMDGYLEKPLLPEKLRAALRSAVQWKTPGLDRPKE